jgi:hypothetical protein
MSMYCHNCGKTLEPDHYHIVTTVKGGQVVSFPECREPCQQRQMTVRILARQAEYKYSRVKGVK